MTSQVREASMSEEMELHARLCLKLGMAPNREWFTLSREELEEIVKALSRYPDNVQGDEK